MKNFIIPLFFLLFSTSFFSQSNEDYVKTLDFISKAFNESKTSIIYQKFSSELKQKLPEGVFKKTLDSLRIEQGAMSSYELIIEEEKGKNYLVEFDSSSMLMMIHLSNDGVISRFKIKEY